MYSHNTEPTVKNPAIRRRLEKLAKLEQDEYEAQLKGKQSVGAPVPTPTSPIKYGGNFNTNSRFDSSQDGQRKFVSPYHQPQPRMSPIFTQPAAAQAPAANHALVDVRAAKLLVYTLTDPGNRFPEEAEFVLSAMGVDVLDTMSAECIDRWAWRQVADYRGMLQSSDPEDMELFLVEVVGIGKYTFECDSFQVLQASFDMWAKGGGGAAAAPADIHSHNMITPGMHIPAHMVHHQHSHISGNALLMYVVEDPTQNFPEEILMVRFCFNFVSCLC
jgi:hypothetical protein